MNVLNDLNITSKLAAMSGVILLVVAASMLYLFSEVGQQAALIGSQDQIVAGQSQLVEKQATLIKHQREALSSLDLAHNFSKTFSEMRYWLFDLAVSWQTEAEENAEKFRDDALAQLNKLSAVDKAFTTWVGPEIESIYTTMMDAVDAYVDENRVLGNSLISSARNRVTAIDERLVTMQRKLADDAKNAGEEVSAAAVKLGASGKQLTQSGQIVVDGISNIRSTTIAMLLLAILLGCGAAWLGARAIVPPITKLCATIEAIEQQSDLTLRSDISSKDEIGKIASSLNAMLEKFDHIIVDVAGSTTQIASAAEEMSTVTEQTNDGMNNQRQQTEQVATAINEMAATVQEVAKHANGAEVSANEADREAKQGSVVVSDTIKAISELSSEIEKATEVIQNLEKESDSIGTVLDVIKGIAEQTNLLALNAAIEAARAGEQGRGFAVVADEVRSLASRTQESTEEIQAMIERLQGGAQQAVKAMEGSRDKAHSSVDQAVKAGDSLHAITSAIATIADMNANIASASEQQGAVAEEINQNIVTISEVADQTANGAQQTASSSTELAGLANNLQQLVGQFKS
ncbi:MAG: methyl-accepting chemotaxis protein [Gammaproteobacteria bacterium]|nr:methyl-accepting chemotaxis protein [Gammaproteobacteria bacterium]